MTVAPDREPQKTIVQGDEAARLASDLSLPGDAVQNPEAPKIAGYVLVSLLGRGSFGEVWRAWQTRTRRWVALKVFLDKRGLNWVLLQREVERLAQLDKHPHVVSLLDADMAADPAYCALELEDGGSLEDRTKPERLADVDTIADWLEKVAEGLVYVHARGIIHCDLKPANILLDEEGRPRLADFGQARTARVDPGSLGTLFFMAPEQAASRSAPDVRWDVYALGATAFALLTGRLPHEETMKRELAATADGDLDTRLVAYRDAVVSDGVPPIDRAGLDRDLAAIVSKCLQPDPKLRYGGMGAVLYDLRARRTGLPVGPLMHDRTYRASKFVRRNAIAVGIAAAAASALVVAGVKMVHERDNLRRQLAVSYLSQAHLQSELNDPIGAVAYAAEANRLAPSFVARATALSFLEDLAVPRFVFSGLASSPSPDGKRLLGGWEEDARVWDLSTGAPVSPPLRHKGAILSSAYSPDGRTAATGGQDQTAVIWDVETGRALATLAHEGTVLVMAYSPDGKYLATGAEDGAARLWEVPGGRLVARMEQKDHVHDLKFLPGGKKLVTMSEEGHTLGFWSVPDGKPLLPLVDLTQKLYGIDVSPDGKLVAAARLDKRAVLVDARTGKQVGPDLPADGRVMLARFSPDGKTVATGGWDGFVRFWRVPTGELVGQPLEHEGTIKWLAFSPSGRLLLTGSTDNLARLWDLKAGREIGRKFDNGAIVREVGFVPGKEDEFYSITVGGLTRLWRYEPARSRETILPHDHAVYDARFSPDGNSFVTASKDGTARVFDRAGKLLVQVRPGGILREADISRDGRRLLTASVAGAAVYSIPDGKLLALHDFGKYPHLGEWSPDGRLAVVSARDGKAIVLDHEGAVVARFAHPARTKVTKFSPDGRFVLTAGRDSTARLWDPKSGAAVGAPMLHDGEIEDAAFFPASDRLVSVSEDHSARVWLVPSGKRDTSLMLRHKDAVRAVAVSPDGKIIATGGDENRVRLWRADTGEAYGRRIMHRAGIEALAFSKDGRVLLTMSSDKSAALWDPRTGLPLGRPMFHDERVVGGSFSPDGAALVTASPDKTARLWSLSWLRQELPPSEVVRRARVATVKVINDEGDPQTFDLNEWKRLAAGGAPR